MKTTISVLTLTVVLLHIGACLAEANEADHVPVRGVVKSCGGCRLNSLPEVRQFIFEDLPKYDHIEFDRIPGHNPDLFLYNAADEEIERIDLAQFGREQCNNLLKEKGFRLKVENEL